MTRKKAKRKLTTKRLREITAWLRKEFPIPDKVSVVRRGYVKMCGWTIFDGEEYTIKISTKFDMQTQVDTLLHEYAHVCAIDQAYKHKGAWPRFFGSIYSAFDATGGKV